MREAGIDFKMAEDDNGFVLEWSPGNGTRYLMSFVQIPENKAKIMGLHPGVFQVTDVLARRTFFTSSGLCHINYVHEKLGWVIEASLIHTAIINLAIGSETYGLELLEQAGGYDELKARGFGRVFGRVQ